MSIIPKNQEQTQIERDDFLTNSEAKSVQYRLIANTFYLPVPDGTDITEDDSMIVVLPPDGNMALVIQTPEIPCGTTFAILKAPVYQVIFTKYYPVFTLDKDVNWIEKRRGCGIVYQLTPRVADEAWDRLHGMLFVNDIAFIFHLLYKAPAVQHKGQKRLIEQITEEWLSQIRLIKEHEEILADERSWQDMIREVERRAKEEERRRQEALKEAESRRHAEEERRCQEELREAERRRKEEEERRRQEELREAERRRKAEEERRRQEELREAERRRKEEEECRRQEELREAERRRKEEEERRRQEEYREAERRRKEAKEHRQQEKLREVERRRKEAEERREEKLREAERRRKEVEEHHRQEELRAAERRCREEEKRRRYEQLQAERAEQEQIVVQNRSWFGQKAKLRKEAQKRLAEIDEVLEKEFPDGIPGIPG